MSFSRKWRFWKQKQKQKQKPPQNRSLRRNPEVRLRERESPPQSAVFLLGCGCQVNMKLEHSLARLTRRGSGACKALQEKQRLNRNQGPHSGSG